MCEREEIVLLGTSFQYWNNFWLLQCIKGACISHTVHKKHNPYIPTGVISAEYEKSHVK